MLISLLGAPEGRKRKHLGPERKGFSVETDPERAMQLAIRSKVKEFQALAAIPHLGDPMVWPLHVIYPGIAGSCAQAPSAGCKKDL